MASDAGGVGAHVLLHNTDEARHPTAHVPLSFDYPIHRRRYLRTVTKYDHARGMPYCIHIPPDSAAVVP